MIDLNSIKSHWHYVIFLAATIQLLLYLYQPDIETSPEVRSAIERAKTELCKKELRQIALKLSLLDGSKIQLERTCKRDFHTQRNLRVGCMNSTSENVSKIENSIENATICLDICFSYGLSHGGLSESSKSCYCGNSQPDSSMRDGDGHCLGPNLLDWFRVDNGIYSTFSPANQTRADFECHKQSARVKIAFLISVHGRGDRQVKRLISAIYSKSHLYFIHVDRRDDFLFHQLSRFYSSYENVILSNSRFRTIWGGTSLLRMMIESMKNLLHFEWDYLINLSGADFLVRELECLEEFLSLNPQTIYLRAHNINGHKFITKQGLDRNFYQCEDRVWNLGRRILPRGIIYSGGSDWFALPRDFCAYVDAHASDSKSLVKPLLLLFNHTLLPVESFFHTLAINSEFCDRVQDHNLHITNWRRKQTCKCQHKDVVDWCGCSPSIYRRQDWYHSSQLKGAAPAKFFARKFDPTISTSIIAKMELKVRGAEESSWENLDTRHWENLYSLGETPNSTDPSITILRQFGRFSILQTNKTIDLEKFYLQSVDLFFNEDRFKGWLLLYCRNMVKSKFCHQLYLERDPGRVIRSKYNCSGDSERFLIAIEINHGFDAVERMFRDFMPLHSMSDIAVYHEWIAEPINGKNATDHVDFLWYNSDSQLELRQMVKLRRPLKRSHLTLAHRLSAPKPFKPGLWTLVIETHQRACLSYQFFMIGSPTKEPSKTDRETFSQFYRVSGSCIYNQSMSNYIEEQSTDADECKSKIWSSFHFE